MKKSAKRILKSPYFWVPSVVVVLLWIAMLIYVKHSGCKLEATGQLGDSFGMLNSLFSGLALVGIVASLIMQREDIEVTLEELKESREAQQDLAKSNEKQAEIQKFRMKLDVELYKIQAKISEKSDYIALEAAFRTRPRGQIFEKAKEYSNEYQELFEDLEKIMDRFEK